MTIIDCHTHAYPSEIASNPTAWATAHKEPHWLDLVAPKNSPSLQDFADPDRFISDMDLAGVQKAVLLGWYWQNQSTCALQNEWHAAWQKAFPDRFIPFAPVQPLAGDVALEDLKKALDHGAKGVGEVFPAAQGFTMNNASWLKIVQFATEKRLPISMHVSEPVGKPYKGHVPSPLYDYQWLVEQFPETPFIFAHWGGGLPFYELNPYCKKIFKNVYYDMSASPLLYDIKIVMNLIDIVGHEKILFGSDYPLRVYPKIQKKADFSTFIKEISQLGLNPTAFEAIMGRNFINLLNKNA